MTTHAHPRAISPAAQRGQWANDTEVAARVRHTLSWHWTTAGCRCQPLEDAPQRTGVTRPGRDGDRARLTIPDWLDGCGIDGPAATSSQSESQPRREKRPFVRAPSPIAMVSVGTNQRSLSARKIERGRRGGCPVARDLSEAAR